MSSKQIMEATREYFRAYRDAHREELNKYARNYYIDNPKKFRKAFDKYKRTKKGKEAIERYEKSEKRMLSKRQYMVEYRAKKKKERDEKKKAKKNESKQK